MLFFLLFFSQAFAQELSPEKLNLTFKEGMAFSKDNDFLMRLRFRVQNRFTLTTENAEDTKLESAEFQVRRMRLRFDGFAINPNLLYRVQLSFTRGDQDWDNAQVPNILRDAVAGWRWNANNVSWVGIAKLPGNRQRVISSSAQQLVDRSLVNATFTVDRDMGIQHFSQVVPNVWIKGALSNGEGRNQINKNASLASTVRLEWYPLGAFHDDGDNFEADLYREPEPRMAFGFANSANQLTARTGGQTGKDMGDGQFRSMETHFVDLVFKYRGYSLSAEYAKRLVANPIIDMSKKLFVFQGEGYNIQSGYIFENNWEPSVRYTRVHAGLGIRDQVQSQYQHTVGLSKYINNHLVKFQTDLSYTERPANAALAYNSDWSLRFQLELGI